VEEERDRVTGRDVEREGKIQREREKEKKNKECVLAWGKCTGPCNRSGRTDTAAHTPFYMSCIHLHTLTSGGEMGVTGRDGGKEDLKNREKRTYWCV
jgi:hypothetical protein